MSASTSAVKRALIAGVSQSSRSVSSAGTYHLQPPVFPVPPLAPKVTRFTPTIDGITVARTDPVAASILSSLCNNDQSLPTEDVESAITAFSDIGFRIDVSPVSARAGLLFYSRRLSTETLVVCLEWFAHAGVPDHLFFKEIGKALLPKVKDLSVADITRLLRAHGTVQVSQSEIFAAIYDRLSSVVSRANMGQIRDIVCALSRLDPTVADCPKMADLCLNRYSLWAKDDIPIAIERDMLVALSRFQMINARVARKAAHRIVAHQSEMSTEDLVEVLSSRNRLGMDTAPLWRTVKAHRTNGLESVADTVAASLVNVFGVVDPEFVFKSCTTLGRFTASASREETVRAYRHVFGVSSLALLEPTIFDALMSRLPVADLRAIDELVSETQKVVTVKPQPHTFLKQKSVALHRATIAGLLETQLVHSP